MTGPLVGASTAGRGTSSHRLGTTTGGARSEESDQCDHGGSSTSGERVARRAACQDVEQVHHAGGADDGCCADEHLDPGGGGAFLRVVHAGSLLGSKQGRESSTVTRQPVAIDHAAIAVTAAPTVASGSAHCWKTVTSPVSSAGRLNRPSRACRCFTGGVAAVRSGCLALMAAVGLLAGASCVTMLRHRLRRQRRPARARQRRPRSRVPPLRSPLLRELRRRSGNVRPSRGAPRSPSARGRSIRRLCRTACSARTGGARGLRSS